MLTVNYFNLRDIFVFLVGSGLILYSFVYVPTTLLPIVIYLIFVLLHYIFNNQCLCNDINEICENCLEINPLLNKEN